MVELLLGKGADVNAQGGHYGNALQAASDGGHEKVVELLLGKGADVNAQGGDYGNQTEATKRWSSCCSAGVPCRNVQAKTLCISSGELSARRICICL